MYLQVGLSMGARLRVFLTYEQDKTLRNRKNSGCATESQRQSGSHQAKCTWHLCGENSIAL
jgi:hypothetical protein